MCLQETFSLLNKNPFVFVCHAFLQSQVGSELLFYQLASMRTPVSFDMLDPVLYVAWRILFRTPIKATPCDSLWRKVFLGQHFFLLKVYKFHHTIFIVLIAFSAISGGF